MKIFAGLKLYPHGFLGAPQETADAHLDRPIQVNVVGVATSRVTLDSGENVVKPNRAICDLYSKIINDPTALEDFQIRERLYYEALNAFGTVTINDWFERQKQNPYFDTRQNRFVEETFRYVFEGQRTYHPSVYLSSMSIGTANAFKIGPYANRWIKDVHGRDQLLIREFLQRWLSQDDGLTDMATSLFIMFGERK
jgi:hypothetical protein